MSTPGKIIIISLQGIGNNIFINTVIKKLKRLFPRSHIDFLIKTPASLEIFNYEQYIRGSYVFPWPPNLKNLIKTIPLLFALRKEKYDVSLTAFPGNHIFFNALAWLIHARKRITHGYKKLYFKSGSFLQNVHIPVDLKAHDIMQNLNLLKYFKVRPVLKDIEYPVRLRDEDRARATEFLKRKKVKSKDILIGLHPGSSEAREMKFKRWDRQNYAALIRSLYQKKKCKFILFTGPEEQAIASWIFQACKKTVPLSHLFINQTGLGEASALIEKCRLMITNDSGLMNVAAGLKIPCVVVQGGANDPVRTAPLGKIHTVINSTIDCYPCRDIASMGKRFTCRTRECLKTISVETVLRAVLKKLK
ncbi:MAG: glycosyltransferase family 9 protein [Spirochaetes bacterium]|nr:glycosyltransferase family 9 protein [Spirochaetota bacterium]